jgi:hypothetical protein
MRTIKLVVIGASGVGKTSLRGQVSIPKFQPLLELSHSTYLPQYISGRFSTGYRATIGADFITKSLPDPKTPTELISLQIWVGLSLELPSYLPFAHATIGYRRPRTLLLPLLRVLPRRRRRPTHVRRQRTRDYARAHEMVGGVQAPSTG